MKLGNERTLFCMTDVSEAWIVRDLSFGEVRAIIASRRREQDINVYIWTESWNDWKNLDDPETLAFKSPRRETQKPPALPLVPFLASVVAPMVAVPKKAAVPNLQSLKSEGPRKASRRRDQAPSISMEDLAEQIEAKEPQTLEPLPKEAAGSVGAPPRSVMGELNGGNRRYARFGVNIPVKVINNTQEYFTVTRDLSEGGVRLADSLPEAFAGYCQVVLTPVNHAPFHLLCSLVEDQEDGKYHLEFVSGDAQVEFVSWFRRQKWSAA